jgi:hypothetical protein
MRRSLTTAAVAALAGTIVACGDVNAALQRIADARQAAADLQVQFAAATDASNRAVMADSDEQSVAFEHEAEQAKRMVAQDLAALRPMIVRLRFEPEIAILDRFTTQYRDYDTLDRRVLELAVENSNLRAQRLSFGPAAQAAEAFAAALARVSASAGPNGWQVKALCADAVASLRQVQVLEAPHIAEPQDAAMDALEVRMRAADADARAAIDRLRGVAPASGQPFVRAAADALDQFMAVHRQILTLSRRNTNVRSLAWSLNEKRKLIGPCEDSLRALREALATRGYAIAPPR